MRIPGQKGQKAHKLKRSHPTLILDVAEMRVTDKTKGRLQIFNPPNHQNIDPLTDKSTVAETHLQMVMAGTTITGITMIAMIPQVGHEVRPQLDTMMAATVGNTTIGTEEVRKIMAADHQVKKVTMTTLPKPPLQREKEEILVVGKVNAKR